MGARFGSTCYATAADAALAECATVSGVTSSGHLRCATVAGTALQPTLTLHLTPPVGDVQVFSTLGQAYRECDPYEPYADLAELSGYALAALLTIWLVKQFVLKLVLPQ